MASLTLFVFCLVSTYIKCEEAVCSKYHYEAQTLERIIKTEIGWQEMAHNVQQLKSDNKRLETTVQEIIANLTHPRQGSDDSMRSFCFYDTDCADVSRTECKWMTCKCKPGLSYHRDTRKCVSDCGEYGYGKTFQEERKTGLAGHNTKIFKPVTLEDCLIRCYEEKQFECRSVEYGHSIQNCQLSNETLYSKPEGKHENTDYDHFTRDCQN